MQPLTLQHDDGAAGHCELRRRLPGHLDRGLRDYALQGNAETPATSGARSVSVGSIDLSQAFRSYVDPR